MKIVIFGAGAIGSLIGAKLSKNNYVILHGRKSHIEKIKKDGLKIIGKTIFNKKITATSSVKEIKIKPDLIILTVKSHDTETAIKQINKLIKKNTIILTIQNGLDHIEIIKKWVNNKIIIGVTTEGSLFVKPGYIKHTGKGITKLGDLDGHNSKIINQIVNLFNESKINTIFSDNILKEIWKKAIINSCVNPLTTIFKCKNGYLLRNPILIETLKFICLESSNIAKNQGFDIFYDEIMKNTIEVLTNTKDNYSSMYQSYYKGKKTEIDSINGQFISKGKKSNSDTILNQILFYLICSMNKNY